VAPDEWAAADAGVDVVVGSRAAAWAPCDGLRAVVVLDEHDEAYQEERSPTWHARDVLVERARRAGASCILTSPCPSATALHWAAGHLVDDGADDPDGWSTIEIDDRSAVEPWRRSMIGSRLIELLRDPSRRVACVLNTTGRARLVACRSCRALQRCEHCTAAVAVDDSGAFRCGRCAMIRPQVCGVCGATAMANVRPGVTRLREELEAAAGRPVALVAGDSDSPVVPESADVVVGTEAVLHRVGGLDTVVFLDLDSELLAPRYRAHEHVLALVVRAVRRVGASSRGGLVLVQTHLPDHEVVSAVASRDLRELSRSELDRRSALGLPPFGALAAVEGPGADDYVAGLALATARTPKGHLVRARDWETLGAALAAASRPRGASVRVAVDPPRA
jgi:primosomal protein N' (replication factor Y)